MLHRLPEQHECLFDHMGRGRQDAVLKMVKLDRKVGRSCQRIGEECSWIVVPSEESLTGILFSCFFFFFFLEIFAFFFFCESGDTNLHLFSLKTMLALFEFHYRLSWLFSAFVGLIISLLPFGKKQTKERQNNKEQRKYTVCSLLLQTLDFIKMNEVRWHE